MVHAPPSHAAQAGSGLNLAFVAGARRGGLRLRSPERPPCLRQLPAERVARGPEPS